MRESVLQEGSKIVLQNINLEIKKGEFVGVIGEVGSGKSSLIQAILNNLILLENTESNQSEFIQNGSIAYVSQIAWLQNDTIKNNILFFSEYEKEKYNEAIELSQLKHDIKNFIGGESTEIGEKGINLSGGQKARVSLARAIYADRDIYVLDDPISALDSHVAEKVMNDCIINHFKHKTRVLVTHSLQYLKHMDKIIYLKHGQILWQGPYEELVNKDFFFHMTSKLHHQEKNDENQTEKTQDIPETEKLKKEEDVNRITVDEEKNIGTVKFSVYVKYFKYMGGFIFSISIMLIMFFWITLKCASDIWLAFWSEDKNQEKSMEQKWIFFYIYSALGISSNIFIFFRVFMLSRAAIKCCFHLHRDMIYSLVNAPINLFHDTIPRGQIYNRLSKDLEGVLTNMYLFGSTFVSLFSILGSFAICAYYEKLSLIFVPFSLLFGYLISRIYLKASRDLTRLGSISRSPLLNTLSETTTGAIIIRAYKFEQMYLNKFYQKMNDVFKVELFVTGTSNWFGLNLDFLSVLFIGFLVLIANLLEEKFTPQSIGLMLTYSLMLNESLFLFFYCTNTFEMNMVSMERCLNYLSIPQEKEFDTQNDKEMEQSWPVNGKIEFVNYSVRYRPTTEIVLHNINITINPGEKIGVVGRTGSGKSTLSLCLFRILEPLNGTIFIDGIDITHIGLNLLRKSLTIIPQDPNLMKGTLKYNIDPLNLYSEEEINNVLEKIGFKNLSKQSSDNDLCRMIGEAGENLSTGEKQLICITRAILRVL